MTTLEQRRIEAARLLRATADRVEQLAARSTAGDWRLGGLLASRPEVVAHRAAEPSGEAVTVAKALLGRLP